MVLASPYDHIQALINICSELQVRTANGREREGKSSIEASLVETPVRGGCVAEQSEPCGDNHLVATVGHVIPVRGSKVPADSKVALYCTILHIVQFSMVVGGGRWWYAGTRTREGIGRRGGRPTAYDLRKGQIDVTTSLTNYHDLYEVCGMPSRLRFNSRPGFLGSWLLHRGP